MKKINKINGKPYDVSVLEVVKYEIESIDDVKVTSTEGFSGLYCKRSSSGNYVEMTGKYTNGPDYYSTVYFTLGVLDYQDRIVSTGLGDVSNIGPYQTKIFDARAPWTEDFKECIIEVDTAYP